jgi:hypothetical protein
VSVWLPRVRDGDGVKRLFEEANLQEGPRVQARYRWHTLAIDQYHPLRPIASIGLTDFGPPFWLGQTCHHGCAHRCTAVPRHEAGLGRRTKIVRALRCHFNA